MRAEVKKVNQINHGSPSELDVFGMELLSTKSSQPSKG